MQKSDFICDYGHTMDRNNQCLNTAIQFYWYEQDRWLIVRCEKHKYLAQYVTQYVKEITYDEAVVYSILNS